MTAKIRQLKKKIAACALALSLFLLAGIPSSRAEAAQLFDADGNGALNKDDVSRFLRAAAGLERVASSNVAAFHRTGQAAQLLRHLDGTDELGVPEGGLNGPDTAEGARAFIAERLLVDLAPFQSELKQYRLTTYDGIASAQPVFTNMAEAFNSAADAAVRDCTERLKAELSGTGLAVLPGKVPQQRFSWKEIASLYRSFGLDLPETVAQCATISILETDGVVFSVALEFPFFDEIAERGTRQQLTASKFALTYLNTVYDDAGVFKEYEKYPLSEAYLSTLVHPLYGDYLIKNGWYDKRSRGTRRHTGTDIIAPARTEIHSVTDGVVLYIGYSETPGNYVIVRDPYGFEYHYYHMVEQSKEVVEGQIVRQGDVIGLVGNTGNSAANHLHLGVVSPDYTYVNPYDMFLDAGITPIRIDEE